MGSKLIHEYSCPATKSECDVFTTPSSQIVIKGKTNTQHLPISNVQGAKRFEFIIPASDSMIDLESVHLQVKFKVTKGDGTDLGAGDNVIPLQYFLNTMFQSVDVFLGSTRITPQVGNYHYRAFLDTLLYSSDKAKGTYLRAALWGTDAVRTAKVSNSKEVQLYGRLHLDIAQQEKFLIPLVPVRFIFTLNNEAVMFRTTLNSLNLKITDMRLWVTKHNIEDSAHEGIELGLQQATAKYFITRNQVDVFNIPSGVKKHVLDNVLHSTMPRLFTIGFLPNSDYAGDLNTDAFKFSNMNITSISAYRGGQILNGGPFTPDYSSDHFAREYVDFYRALCQEHNSPDVNIDMSDYKNHLCFYSFNLTPDNSNCGGEDGLVQLLQSDSIRIEVTFEDVIQEPVTMVIYSQYDNLIQINRDREVHIDY